MNESSAPNGADMNSVLSNEFHMDIGSGDTFGNENDESDENDDFEFESDDGEENRPLTIQMVLKRHIPKTLIGNDIAKGIDDEHIARYAFQLTRLYLDGLRIDKIDAIHLFNNVTHLYLQRNHITSIAELRYCPALTFLVLRKNRIADIDGINHLESLLFLDLGENCIERIEPVTQLPLSLMHLKIDSNPCSDNEATLEAIRKTLHNLQNLNGLSLFDADGSNSTLDAQETPISSINEPADSCEPGLSSAAELSLEDASADLSNRASAMIDRARARLGALRLDFDDAKLSTK